MKTNEEILEEVADLVKELEELKKQIKKQNCDNKEKTKIKNELASVVSGEHLLLAIRGMKILCFVKFVRNQLCLENYEVDYIDKDSDLAKLWQELASNSPHVHDRMIKNTIMKSPGFIVHEEHCRILQDKILNIVFDD